MAGFGLIFDAALCCDECEAVGTVENNELGLAYFADALLDSLDDGCLFGIGEVSVGCDPDDSADILAHSAALCLDHEAGGLAEVQLAAVAGGILTKLEDDVLIFGKLFDVSAYCSLLRFGVGVVVFLCCEYAAAHCHADDEYQSCDSVKSSYCVLSHFLISCLALRLAPQMRSCFLQLKFNRRGLYYWLHFNKCLSNMKIFLLFYIKITEYGAFLYFSSHFHSLYYMKCNQYAVCAPSYIDIFTIIC